MESVVKLYPNCVTYKVLNQSGGVVTAYAKYNGKWKNVTRKERELQSLKRKIEKLKKQLEEF